MSFEQGLRVLGLAIRSFHKIVGDLTKEDEREMCFQGFLAFLDPLKESSRAAIEGLSAKGVEVKVRRLQCSDLPLCCHALSDRLCCSTRMLTRSTSVILLTQVLTGDNLDVAKTVCQQLGIPTSVCVTGAQLANATEEEVLALAVAGSLFAKLSPNQKLQVVQALQKADKVVGFLGDGTNDALALRAADVGVSVDSGKHCGRV